MAIAAVDTLALAKRLRAAGFSEDQAEAIMGVAREASQSDLSVHFTKAELATFKADLKAKALKWLIGGLVGLQVLVILGGILLVELGFAR
jgi:hypothetical protein